MTQWRIIFLFLTFGCGQTIEKTSENKLTTAQAAIWRIDSLDIPQCELCDELRMKLNMLFGNEVSVGDKLIMTEKKLIHVSMKGDTLATNNFRFLDKNLEIFGSDWFDYAEILSLNNSKLILSKTQRIAYKQGDEHIDKNLIIHLIKEK